MAATNNTAEAVDKLATMFPTIATARIQEILVTECDGDTTKTIVILNKVEEINKNMNTNNSGEGSAQQIPLQVVDAQPPVDAPQNEKDCCTDCCGTQCECCCAAGCEGCAMKPASYENGLYPIDFRMYNISFLLFALLTFYPEISLYPITPNFLFISVIGLALIFIATLFMFCGSNENGSVRGILYIVGGSLYFASYLIHAARWQHYQRYDYYYGHHHHGYYNDDIIPGWEYFVGRAIFVGLHAIFIGSVYVTRNNVESCCCFRSCCSAHCMKRSEFIKYWTILFVLYAGLCFLFAMPRGDLYAFMLLTGCTPLIVFITLFFNFCCIKKSDESGGCNSAGSLALVIVISHYIQVGLFAVYMIGNMYLDYMLWEFGLFVFGALQLWILTRAMHPVAANCGCRQDGSGDGNVLSPVQSDDKAVPQTEPYVNSAY